MSKPNTIFNLCTHGELLLWLLWSPFVSFRSLQDGKAGGGNFSGFCTTSPSAVSEIRKECLIGIWQMSIYNWYRKLTTNIGFLKLVFSMFSLYVPVIRYCKTKSVQTVLPDTRWTPVCYFEYYHFTLTKKWNLVTNNAWHNSKKCTLTIFGY